MMMPGLIDPHVHMMGAPINKANLYIANLGDKDAMIAEIKAFAEANPDLPNIRGEAWNLGVFENNSPRKEWLDEIVPDRPAYFYSQTGHETGEPTGTIKEYTMSLFPISISNR